MQAEHLKTPSLFILKTLENYPKYESVDLFSAIIAKALYSW